MAHNSFGEGDSLPLAKKLARKMADNEPFTNYLMMQAIGRLSDMSRSKGLFSESMAATLSTSSDGAKKGLRAYLRKRESTFI